MIENVLITALNLTRDLQDVDFLNINLEVLMLGFK